jgi:hypothetical protein
MRTIKELLQVMLENKDLFFSGLCSWATNLVMRCKITDDEYDELLFYIKNNRPSKYSSLSAFLCQDSEHYWSFGKISPRIKWIKKHIKRNQS